MPKNPENIRPQTGRSKSFKMAIVVCIIAIIISLSVSNPYHKVYDSFIEPDSTMNASNLTRWYYALTALSTVGLYHMKGPIVTTKLGDIEGISSSSRGGREYFEYRGIPFATPPEGNLRFEAPLPALPWKGVRNGGQWGSPCLQFDAMLRAIVVGKEDCLFLNIFTGNVKPEKLRPVLAYIHGGGFTGGESNVFGAQYWMDDDLVVVTFNYRLASLGFLNTGDELIRGNMGLKDQNMALRWIRDNIEAFGGDPNQVTLMGESAGGASVHYHVISPLSRGLFQRAIIQSGNVACPWALTRNPQHQAMRFGKLVKCPTENTTVLVDCLKKMDPIKIIEQHIEIMSPVHKQDDFFPGSIEAVQREDTFLSENPFDMLERGDFAHIPVIFGVNNAEGGLKTARLEAYPHIQSEMDTKWNEHVPVLMHYDPNRTDVSDQIRAYYFSKNETNALKKPVNITDDLETLTRMLSDGIFFEPQHRVAKYHSKYAPTYLYFYTYQSTVFPSTYSMIRAGQPKRWYPFNVVSSVASDYADKYYWTEKDPRRFGACHGEDVAMVWSPSPVTFIRSSWSDYPFSKEIVRCFTQFTKNEPNLRFGNVTWPAISSDANTTHSYMTLGREVAIIEEPFKKDRLFLESLNIRDPHEKYNW